MIPRVLVVLDTSAAWSRGILRGFCAFAHERGWCLLHYHPTADLEWLVREWQPDAAVLGPDVRGVWALGVPRTTVSVNADRSREGLSSVCLDEQRIAELAVSHFFARGYRTLSTFRFDESPFAAARERYFCERAADSGATIAPGWWVNGRVPSRRVESASEMTEWLAGLPKPCGVFACCDSWGRVLARYARANGLRVPEDLALVGVDNDTVECELIAPPLSSVAIPWQLVGHETARLVHRGLRGEAIAGIRVVIPPVDVIARRSSDALTIDDPIVAPAVGWIREHAESRLTVPVIAGAVGVSRQRLERRFRAVLGRTVGEELRRSRVEAAKHLLCATRWDLPQVARRTGFGTAAHLCVAFRREVGVPPGAYRRNVQRAAADDD